MKFFIHPPLLCLLPSADWPSQRLTGIIRIVRRLRSMCHVWEVLWISMYKHTLPHPIRRGERISQRSKGLKWNFPSNSSRIRTTSFTGRDALVQLPVCCVARSSLSENNEGGTYYRVMEGVALIRFNQNTWVVLSVYPKGFPQSAL